MDEYLSGRRLYGDDFSADQISAWYVDEVEGYASLGSADSSQYRYVYHALNWYHAFRFKGLPECTKVLGFGSAYGDELLPILGSTNELTIIDPSDAFYSEKVHGVSCRYIKPVPSGLLPLRIASLMC